MLPDSEIGGGIVRRRIDRGEDAPILAGVVMTRGQIIDMPAANRRAMIDSGQIAVWPKHAAQPGAAISAETERHIVHNGGGRFDVIEGRKLNDRILTREEAEDLATQPG